MKTKRKILVICILGVIALMVWALSPYPTIDEAQVHPSLRGLDDSTKCAWTGFSDGWSIVIEVVRADGTKVILCMSNSLDHSFSERGQLYIGAAHFSEPGAMKIAGYDHTKFVVAKLLARDIPKYPSLRGKIALMTKRIPDWISFAIDSGPSDAYEALRITL